MRIKGQQQSNIKKILFVQTFNQMVFGVKTSRVELAMREAVQYGLMGQQMRLNGTSANLRSNKWIKIEDLLYGVMVPSGNDAAYLIAQVFGLLLYYEPLKSQEKDYQGIEPIDISLYETPFHL